MYFRTEIRARAATDESSKVEADVNRMSLQLGDRENSREKAIARTEQLAKKVLGIFKCKTERGSGVIWERILTNVP